MNDLNKITEKAVELVPEIYKDGLQPVVEETGKILGMVPRAIKAALLPLEKWILHREYSLEETEKLLQIKLENVKPENIITPEPFVAVPALQAISYCLDSVELRTMFANLLANSMNTATKDKVHPAFVDIIKQLSPLDAKLIMEFRPKTAQYFHAQMSMGRKYTKEINGDWVDENGVIVPIDENGNPIYESPKIDFTMPKDLKPSFYTFPDIPKPLASYWLAKEIDQFGNVKNGILALDNVILTAESDDVQLISASITNLRRLGLIETNNVMTIMNDSMYDGFSQTPFCIGWKKFIENKDGQSWFSGVRGNMVTHGQYKDIVIKKGIARLTQFGFDFTSVCVLENEMVLGEQ